MISYLILALITLASGILSAFLFQYYLIMPGLIFGIVTGLWFYFTEKISLLKLVIWIALSTLAYLGAWIIAFVVAGFTSLPGDTAETINLESVYGLLLAGIFGSAILAVSANRLIKKINSVQIYITILLGGIAGGLFLVFDDLMSLSFAVWQVCVGLALGITLNHYDKKPLV